MKINLELDLTHLGFDIDEDGDPYPTTDLIGRVADRIAERLLNDYEIRNTVESRVCDLADERARVVINEVLSGPIRRTDGYGNPRGEATTVREMVMAAVDEWMRLPSADAFSRHRTMGSELEKIVDELLRKEMQPTVRKATELIRSEVLRLAIEGASKALADARVIA